MIIIKMNDLREDKLPKTDENSWNYKIISKMSRKGELTNFITDLEHFNSNPELTSSPHIRVMYSNNLQAVAEGGQAMCENINYFKKANILENI
jgi:hypothetical protein